MKNWSAATMRAHFKRAQCLGWLAMVESESEMACGSRELQRTLAAMDEELSQLKQVLASSATCLKLLRDVRP